MIPLPQSLAGIAGLLAAHLWHEDDIHSVPLTAVGQRNLERLD